MKDTSPEGRCSSFTGSVSAGLRLIGPEVVRQLHALQERAGRVRPTDPVKPRHGEPLLPLDLERDVRHGGSPLPAERRVEGRGGDA